MFIGIVSVRLIDFSTGCHWYDFVLTDRWQLTGKWPFESSKGGRLGCVIGGKHMKPSWFLGWERGACLSAKSFVRNSAQNLSCLYTVGVLSFGDLLDSSSRHCIYKYLTFLNEPQTTEMKDSSIEELKESLHAARTSISINPYSFCHLDISSTCLLIVLFAADIRCRCWNSVSKFHGASVYCPSSLRRWRKVL